MNNVEKIREALIEKGLDALLISDEKNLRYASGLAFSGGAMLISKSGAWLFTDSRYEEAAQRTLDKNIALRIFGAGKRLTELIKAELGDIEKLGAEEETLPHGTYLLYEQRLNRSLIPSQEILNGLRASKSAQEQEYMRHAQQIAEAALSDVLGIIRPGISERDIAAEITYRLLKHGGEGNSFDPIAVTGVNSSMPHGVPGDTLVKAGDFVTMDFGCVYKGYCSDMTRTYAVGYASDEMKNVYDTVLSAQLAGIKAARAGVTGHDIDKAARDVIDSAGYGKNFGHSFGHSLGLNIHESPNASPNSETVMPNGAVISAEPGIYLPGKFGVRIEDVLILNENGNENITHANKELIIL